MRKIIIIIACSFCGFGSHAQELIFNRLTSEDGLSPGAVLAIAQDDKGFMWFGTQHGLNRFDTRRFKLYENDYVNCLLFDSHKTLWIGTSAGLSLYRPGPDSLQRIRLGKAPGNIGCIYEDHQKNIWVWSSNGLYKLADRKKLTFDNIPVPDSVAGLGDNNSRVIWQDHTGAYWIGSSAGLTRLEYKNGQPHYITFRHSDSNPQGISDNYITVIREDGQRRLWIGTQRGGVNIYDSVKQTFTCYKTANTPGFVNNNIRTITADQTGRLWIGTQGGISIYDPADGRFTPYRSIPDNNRSLSHNSVYSIFKDRHDNMWVGTYWGGVNSVFTDNKPFHTYRSSLYQPGINNNVVSSVVEDKSHNLWVGTEGGGINYIERSSNHVSYFQFDPENKASLGSNLIKVIYKDRDENIWAGTHGGGLNLFDPARHTFTRFLYKENDPMVRGGEVLSLLEDKDSIFWVGTQRGLLAFKKKHTSLQPVPDNRLMQAIGKTAVKAIVQLNDGDIWIGASTGLFYRQYTTGAVRRFTTADGLPGNDINCIYEDYRGNVWAGCSFGGMVRYAPSTGKNLFKIYQKKDGLADDNVTSILGDDGGSLWIGTGNGLSKLDIKNNSFKNYNKSDGLAGNTFNINSFCKIHDGQLFLGGYNGLTFFYPSAIRENPVPPATYLTGLRLFNNPVTIDESGLLKKEISLVQDIRFTHTQNVFTLEFATLNYNRPDKNSYAYKLDGFDKDWNYSGTPSATYMNLPAGNYTFWAKGANNDGVWGPPVRLRITVLPPFWKTIWAYILYSIAIAAFAFFIIRFFILRALIRHDRELTRFKLDFFTNISHEMRTHLALIIGPAERLLLTNREDYENTGQLRIIKKNSESLLHLLTEIMDFRKAETGNITLNVTEGNIVSFVRDIFTSFYDLSVSMNIKSDFLASAPDLNLYFDRLQLEKVFYNLLYNAYKFTPRGGNITVTIEEKKDTVTIEVSDNGKGIAPENLPRLFTNYFQEDDRGQDNKGYGIGLALAKSLVELHKGSIEVESTRTEDGNMTTFSVTLRKGKAHFSIPPAAATTTPEIISDNNYGSYTSPIPVGDNDIVKKRQHTLLLVEDNTELLSFMRSILEKDYNIIEETNGLSGWEAAVGSIPDLIVSDVMMPELDGYTLCHRLKNDERTSHIPVVLLTAMTAAVHQVSGLEKGADVYLTKPFNTQVLQLQIVNLLQLREKIRSRVKQQLADPQQPLQDIELSVDINSAPDPFLHKAIKIIEDHMDDPELNVDTFVRMLAMSRPVLYKKINAVSGLSVNDLIKSIRLNKATQHLDEGKYNISEIAYMVGFSDPKYFSREFKKKFGRTPKEWRQV